MDQREFLRRHLPPGAQDGHQVLYDWKGEVDPTPPTAEQLDACVRDLAPILRAVRSPGGLYSTLDESGEFRRGGHGACELTLGLLWRGANAGVALPQGEAVVELMTEIQRLLAAPVFGAFDAVKRLRAIERVLTPRPDGEIG